MLKKILKNILTARKTCSPSESGNEHPELKKNFVSVLGRSLRIRQVDAGSCNACEWECTALTNPLYDIQRFGIDFVASPRHTDLLLVTGSVSRQMELALRKTFDATPEPRIVVACGDCAIDGGVFRGSYAVTDGAASIIPLILLYWVAHLSLPTLCRRWYS